MVARTPKRRLVDRMKDAIGDWWKTMTNKQRWNKDVYRL